MQKFNNILFVSQGVTDETDALKQALSIARNNKAKLKALIVCPELPKDMIRYRETYESSLIEQLKSSIQTTCNALKLAEAEISVKIEIETSNTPAMRIVSYVLRNAHDLVIKDVEKKGEGKGFKAIDMDLLRKCPCPVWLSRPISKSRNEIKVAVAIDPQSISNEQQYLSLRLLELSRSVADTCSGQLNIISCWDYEFEEYLRHNIWLEMPDDEIIKTVNSARSQHRTALDDIIKKSEIVGNIQLDHLRGKADQVIPQYVVDKDIDILVMGTVARTGISGFLIGNTAENILQNLECSLLALKPNGFVSPVKA